MNEGNRIGKWIRRVQQLIIALVALLAVAWASLEIAISCVSLPDNLWSTDTGSTIYLDRNDRPLRISRNGADTFVLPVALVDCPKHFLLAVLAAEDKRFWDHHGVDFFATARAGRDYLKQGRVVSGASTITQQLIKISQERPRTIYTKVIENLQAMRLERVWNKRRILEEYLNRLDYGNLCKGPAIAARYYFDKPLNDLSVAEAALLAALPNAPTRLNPHGNLSGARARQQLILDRMARNGWLTHDAMERAKNELLVLNIDGRDFEAPHFVDLINNKNKYGGKCRSTLDLALNNRVNGVLRHHLGGLAKSNVSNGSVVVIKNATGDVISLIGSHDWNDRDSGQVNGAMARRSAGSTFKPFTYCLALEKGATASTVIADVPTDFSTITGVFSPKNYNRRFNGPVRLRNALANSLNIAAVKVLQLGGGPGELLQRLRQCGLTTLTGDADHYGLGLTIGNAEARLLELSNAYACLARLGQFKPARLLSSDVAPSYQIFDESAAWLIADILHDNHARTQAFGADSPLSFEFPVACKTGTSTDFRDNWAFAYTPEFTVGVWVGNFDGSPMHNISGVTGAAPVMHEIMVHLHEQFGTSWYKRPSDVEELSVHPITGKTCPVGIHEWFIAGTHPAVEKPEDFDGEGRVKLNADYAQWLDSADNWLGIRAILSKECDTEVSLVHPMPGTVFYIDPDLPESSQKIQLHLNLKSEVEWTSPTLKCRSEFKGTWVRLKPGRHDLSAIANGKRIKTWIIVEEL